MNEALIPLANYLTSNRLIRKHYDGCGGGGGNKDL